MRGDGFWSTNDGTIVASDVGTAVEVAIGQCRVRLHPADADALGEWLCTRHAQPLVGGECLCGGHVECTVCDGTGVVPPVVKVDFSEVGL